MIFLNYIDLGSDKTLIYLGDVSGHGFRSGLVASKAMEYISLKAEGVVGSESLVPLVEGLQRHLWKKKLGEDYLTLVIGILDGKTNTFDFVSAGHPYVGVRREEEAEFKFLKFKASLPIGLSETRGKDKLVSYTMEAGESLVILSDGVGENLLKLKEKFRNEIFQRATQGPIQVLPSSLIESVLRDEKDDATIIHIVPRDIFEKGMYYTSNVIRNQEELEQELDSFMNHYQLRLSESVLMQKIMLVISEFCTNCIVHGKDWDNLTDPSIIFTISLKDKFELRVFHDSQPYMLTQKISEAELPSDDSGSGRGQFIIKQVSSDIYEQVFSKLMVNQFFFSGV